MSTSIPRRIGRRLEDVVGGPDRLRVVAILAGVLGLDAADKATVGAVAPQLKESLNIGNPEIGLLAAISTGVAVVATLPLGMLVDRVNRIAFRPVETGRAA